MKRSNQYVIILWNSVKTTRKIQWVFEVDISFIVICLTKLHACFLGPLKFHKYSFSFNNFIHKSFGSF